MLGGIRCVGDWLVNAGKVVGWIGKERYIAAMMMFTCGRRYRSQEIIGRKYPYVIPIVISLF